MESRYEILFAEKWRKPWVLLMRFLLPIALLGMLATPAWAQTAPAAMKKALAKKSTPNKGRNSPGLY